MFVSDTVVTAIILNTTFIRLGLALKAQRSSKCSIGGKIEEPYPAQNMEAEIISSSSDPPQTSASISSYT